ncbi:hypothetical protein KIN20_033687 [Parelaphostrongylus tenuis]|uniref:Peptidase M13 N-terminal domain-containing protein n=1 Tax=Parelaphostrongylus tenuis TaxID=148309 RepID=A0AAD5R934_PARTN|nr:hypothetical protein KIN20_033687 [Parelaphostrongylus tenuis]
MPREFYVLPQFVNKLSNRAQDTAAVMRLFASDVVNDTSPYNDTIKKIRLKSFHSDNWPASQDVANFGTLIAMASWPDQEMRNYRRLYNPYKLDTLTQAYPSIKWKSYLSSLLSSVENAVDIASNQVVHMQSIYCTMSNTVMPTVTYMGVD